LLYLINFDRGVDEPSEPKACIKSNGTGYHKKCIRRYKHVPKVKYRRYQLCDFTLGEEVESCIKKEVKCGGTRGKV
ncbi:hypothetical protein P3687_25075, partial [Vibrio parahaemolyticus]|nr:hypothetical protein [Vibrio parahaemolyticus]